MLKTDQEPGRRIYFITEKFGLLHGLNVNGKLDRFSGQFKKKLL
jgi:hypothetical protein